MAGKQEFSTEQKALLNAYKEKLLHPACGIANTCQITNGGLAIRNAQQVFPEATGAYLFYMDGKFTLGLLGDDEKITSVEVE